MHTHEMRLYARSRKMNKLLPFTDLGQRDELVFFLLALGDQVK